ncbi:MAG TPA: hypothetical protein DCQ31_00100 [Bacteroidales bacterium]|nr:hypothetical protein [Bacteroidales bacterium]
MKNILAFAVFLIAISGWSQTADSEWDDYFMPGIGYKMFVPKNIAELGTYKGVMTEFVIYARAKGSKSTYSGPARFKTYANLCIMSGDSELSKDIFYSNLGLNLSFEANTNRQFAIPYFGIELGGLFRRDFSTFHFTPIAGIQLVSSRTVIWNIQGGYQYTVKRFDEYSGYLISSTLNILLWNSKPQKEI